VAARLQDIIVPEFNMLALAQQVLVMVQLAVILQYSGQCPEHTHLLFHVV
jgi:hypothetical protein